MNNDTPQGPPRFKRRQFLANLLFAGGALTLGSLQGAMAQPSDLPIEDGWELPQEIQDRLERKPEGRPDPVPQALPPSPNPPPSPPPCPAPDAKPPMVLGKMVIPRPAPPKK